MFYAGLNREIALSVIENQVLVVLEEEGWTVTDLEIGQDAGKIYKMIVKFEDDDVKCGIGRYWFNIDNGHVIKYVLSAYVDGKLEWESSTDTEGYDLPLPIYGY